MVDKKSLYYMAPMNNAPLIVRHGILSHNRLTSNESLRAASVSIADPFVNERRHAICIGDRSLHDYVPLYWATHTPMQYVVTIQRGELTQHDLVFFVLDARRILELPGVWTTDGNAASDKTKFFEGDGALAHLDWKVLSNRCCFSPDYKRRKCAEVLVPDAVSPHMIAHIAVYNTEARDRLLRGVKKVLHSKARGRFTDDMVRPRPNLYYTEVVSL